MNVAVVGHVTGGIPTGSGMPSVSDVQRLLLPAVGILVVGYTDTVLTGRAFAEARGLVRLRSPDGSRCKWHERAEVEALIDAGWRLA